jgi:hypothetical protein
MPRSLETVWSYDFELYSLNTVAVTVSFDSIPDNFTRMAQTKTVGGVFGDLLCVSKELR